MTTHGGNDARTGTDGDASGTSTGASVTSRMAGTHDAGTHDTDTHETHETAETTHGRHASPAPPVERYEERARILPAKTSAAAAFALVFGLAALFSALTAVLAPLAVLFGLLGIGLGIAGLKMAKRAGVTGKGVATGGLITAVLGLLLGGAVLAGLAVIVNDEQQLDRFQERIDDIRDDLPSAEEIGDELTN